MLKSVLAAARNKAAEEEALAQEREEEAQQKLVGGEEEPVRRRRPARKANVPDDHALLGLEEGPALNRLDLSHSGITQLPDCGDDELHVKSAWLHGNSLVAFPRAVFRMPFLASLRLENNNLMQIPHNVGDCSALSALRLVARAGTGRFKS